MQLETRSSLTEAVARLERDLLQMPQAAIQTSHTFLPGLYLRSITIPPWTVLTGAPHLTDYIVRLEKGTIAVNTANGIVVLTAPAEFHAPVGCKRVGRVFDEEVVWTDIFENPDDCRDLPTLESRLYDQSAGELGETRELRRIRACRADYAEFLSQISVTQEQMDAIVHIDTDLIPMPPGFSVALRRSNIHGIGLFCTAVMQAGHPICPGRLSGMRTPAGRYINHSPQPNAASYLHSNGDIWAVALRDMQENEEITIDYRDAMHVNFGIEMKGKTLCQDG